MPNMILMDFLKRFETIIFDLDGVIIDSCQLKINCMREALNDFNKNLVEEFLLAFRSHFGKSRRFHFNHFFSRYLKQTTDFENFYETYAKRYERLLKDRYSLADLCEGAPRLIESLAKTGRPLFVATGTATEEAELVLTNTGLRQFFRRVIGSPCEKAQAVSSILGSTQVSPSKTILIGDSIHDKESAMINKIKFLFVQQYSCHTKNEMILMTDNLFSTVLNLDPLNQVKASTESE